MTLSTGKEDPHVLTYNDFSGSSSGQDGNARQGTKKTLEVDVVLGGSGANSRVAKDIKAGDYEYAIAFQERMMVEEERMEYYNDRVEMCVGGWILMDMTLAVETREGDIWVAGQMAMTGSMQ